VIGNAPRLLDRNITVAGRIVKGIELLSSLPRGTGNLGFYEKPEMHVPIKSVRLLSDVPEADRVPLEILRTDSDTFRALIEARRNRRDDWYKVPAGAIDVCASSIPTRTRRLRHSRSLPMPNRLATAAVLVAALFMSPARAAIDVAEASIADLQKAMTSGKASSKEITQAYIARIKSLDKGGPKINAVIVINPDALAIAAALDKERKEKGPRGPLHGIRCS
jgi:hypothetical protein